MTKADCLPCRTGKSHTFHDSGDPNLAYAYEGTEPPVQDSSADQSSCTIENCFCDDGWTPEEMRAFARGLVKDEPEITDDIRKRARWLGTEHKPTDLMRQAEDLVYGDRQGAYGHPYDDYSRTAGMWSSFLGVEITPAQAALMMVLLKISRERNRPKDDNIVDAHGYLLCYGRIQGREDRD